MVNGTLEKPYKVTFSDGRHSFFADLSISLGGEDKGPNPHEILEAALVGCTLQTMQMYGSRKGWNLGHTKVGVKVLEEGTQVRIGRVLHFDASLTEEQQLKLTEIANKCPIHKLLHAPITVETERA